MSGNGWFTARKSSAQIARDKARAEGIRRRRKGLPEKKGKKTKKKTDWEDEEDDETDDGSIVDFVVDDGDDDDEEEADWSEGDEEEDEITESSPVERSSKQKSKKSAFEADSSSDDDDDDDKFLSLMSKPSHRKSRPAPHIMAQRKKKVSDSQKPNRKLKKSALLQFEPKKTASLKTDGSKKRSFDSGDDERVQKVPPKKNKVEDILESSSDDDTLLADPFRKPNAKKFAAVARKEAVSRYFAPRQGSSDLKAEEHLTPVVARRSNYSRTRVFDDDSDGNVPVDATKAAPFCLDDSDQDDEDMKFAKQRSLMQVSSASSLVDIVDSEDELRTDEDMAVALAIEESRRDAPKVGKKNRFSAFSANPASILERVGKSDEDKERVVDEDLEDEDDNYDGGEELDKDAEEARVVLATAKRLSGQILQSLTSWGGSGGMIVQDGAIGFAGDDAVEPENEVSSAWISNETMKMACPNVELAPYQLIGVNWLALLHNLTVEVDGKQTNVNGILADEMGLGKTCQTISFLAWLKFNEKQERNGVAERNRISDKNSDDESVVLLERPAAPKPHLIVVPASTLSNWVIEFGKFAPHLNVVKYHGSMAEREEIKDHLREYLSGKATRNGDSLDVILAPLTYFQKEKSDDRSFLRKFKFEYLICDEGHLLKNHQGQRYKTLDKFRTNHRLLLSGTPVMNNPQELMSLLCFLMPLFSRKSQEFSSDGDKNDGGSGMLQHFVELDSQGRGKNDAQTYKKLKELFAPFVLRRRKLDVLSQIMPPKTRKVEFVELDPIGRRIYDSVLERHVRNKESRAREHLFTQLRKAAHHPLLLRTRYLDKSEKEHLTDCFYKYGAFRGEGCTREKVAEEVEKFNDFDIHLTALELLQTNPLREDLRRYVLQEEDLFSSAKCRRLRKLLPELVGKGHRVLVFSVWTNCLDLLSCLLEQLNLKYLRMEGSTAVSERQSLIDEFNRDESIPIFLLSTKACGLGINLTAADTCIMHDIDFNPFNDLQAEDRCHRIGQKKPVTVYKLVAKDTVDQDIHSMQERKAKMSAAIMESSDFESKNERDNVLKTAVDRFLSSPLGHKKVVEKENGINIHSRDSL